MYCRYITGANKNDQFFFFLKKTYPDALKTTRIRFGIGYGIMAYTSAFESDGIGLLNFIHSRPILALLRALE